MRHRPLTGYRRSALVLSVAGLAVWLMAAVGGHAGLRINTSASIALGLYRTSAAPVSRGAYVLLCPPASAPFTMALQRGYLGAGGCPGGAGYLMKKIAAAQGDVVSVAADGVHVNGARLACSTPLAADPAGRALPRYRMRARALGAAELLLMAPASALSFDARYFGPLPTAQIESVIVPWLTWPSGLHGSGADGPVGASAWRAGSAGATSVQGATDSVDALRHQVPGPGGASTPAGDRHHHVKERCP